MIIFLSMIIKFFMTLIKNAEASQVAAVPCQEHGALLVFRQAQEVCRAGCIFSTSLQSSFKNL